MGLSGPSCRCVIFSSSVQFSRLPPRIARSFINNSRTPDSSLQRKEKTAKIKSFSCRLLIYLPVLPSLIPVFFFSFFQFPIVYFIFGILYNNFQIRAVFHMLDMFVIVFQSVVKMMKKAELVRLLFQFFFFLVIGSKSLCS